MHYYADSSALVQRHVEEAGSGWVRANLGANSASLVITSDISVVEMFSAINRRVREGTLASTDYPKVRADVLQLCAMAYQFIELSLALRDRAVELIERHPLRAYDAIQLASALSANEILVRANSDPLVFVSADRRLLDAARAENLLVHNPNEQIATSQ